MWHGLVTVVNLAQETNDTSVRYGNISVYAQWMMYYICLTAELIYTRGINSLLLGSVFCIMGGPYESDQTWS